MHNMIPHGVGMDFTWALTVGVVVYSTAAFGGYMLFNMIARRRRRHARDDGRRGRT